MRLSHLHLPTPIPYTHSLRLQESLLEKHFTHKTLLRSNPSPSPSQPLPPAPSPTLLTFQTHPTYTIGRRHLRDNPLSASQISYLTGTSRTPTAPAASSALATFHPSPRGGLLTYHAPGQLTAYLILDLRTHKLTPRCYIRRLEETVMRTCRRMGVVEVLTTEDPGVWIGERSEGGVRATDRKVCAVGVHVSRGVTSHGVGLNVWDQPLAVERDVGGEGSAQGHLSWGFGRIVACGLEGKSVTWLQREVEESRARHITIDNVAKVLAEEVAVTLDIQGDAIDKVSEEEVLA